MKKSVLCTTVVLCTLVMGGQNGQSPYQGTFDQLVGMVLDASRTGQRVFVEEFTGIN